MRKIAQIIAVFCLIAITLLGWMIYAYSIYLAAEWRLDRRLVNVSSSGSRADLLDYCLISDDGLGFTAF